MKKYDIIMCYDDCMWHIEKCASIFRCLESWLFEWQEEFQRKPDFLSMVVGIETYKKICEGNVDKLISTTDEFCKFELLGVDFKCSPDWSVHPNYMELNLK